MAIFFMWVTSLLFGAARVNRPSGARHRISGALSARSI